MLVLTFAASGVGNCAEVGGVPYVYARTGRGAFITAARCSHRGGPLHLATIDASGNRLLCPWHDQPTSMTRLLRKGIPAVRSGNRVTAVFPVAADTEVGTSHRPLSPDLCGARRAG